MEIWVRQSLELTRASHFHYKDLHLLNDHIQYSLIVGSFLITLSGIFCSKFLF